MGLRLAGWWLVGSSAGALSFSLKARRDEDLGVQSVVNLTGGWFVRVAENAQEVVDSGSLKGWPGSRYSSEMASLPVGVGAV